MAFINERFPVAISFHAKGGPRFHTTIAAVASGDESRNQDWQAERGRWEVAHAVRKPDKWQPLQAFFRVMRGRANSFPFKDWTDYVATHTNGVIGAGVGTGAPTLQLGKVYTFGGHTAVRWIYKPVNGTVAVKKNGALITEGSSAGNWEVDLSQGLVTFTATSTKTITGITKANPAVVTATAHGFTNGMKVYITGVAGMTDVNSLIFTVASATTNTFALSGIDSTNYTTYTSGGSANVYPQPSDTLTAAFEFDIPCRFDIDDMVGEIVDKTPDGQLIMSWDSIPVIEVRPEA